MNKTRSDFHLARLLVCGFFLFGSVCMLNAAEVLFSFRFDGTFGFVNPDGVVVIPPVYETVMNFQGETAFVMVRKHWGLINRKNVFLVQPIFDEVKPFREDAARVRIGDYWGYIRPNGEFILFPILETAGDFSNGVAKVEINGREGFLDMDGNLTWPGQNLWWQLNDNQ